jgi:MOSC domain-containing protein YiiM
MNDALHTSPAGLNAASPLAALFNAPARAGVVTWIGLRPARRQVVLAVQQAEIDPEDGLVGDHYQSRRSQNRQVTLMQAEHLAAIAAYLGAGQIEPETLRRNIVVSGINLSALQGRHFRLGSAVLLATGACHPCSRMEEALGAGGYNAVRGHGGITARVISGGRVCIGDALTRIDDPFTRTDDSAL